MLKALAQLENGRFVILLGITDRNIRLLKQDKPISFETFDMGLPPGGGVEGITLFYGKDELDLSRIIKGLVGPETKTYALPRKEDRPQ